MVYALVNYLANNKKGNEALTKLKEIYKDNEIKIKDIVQTDIKSFFDELSLDDIVIICGGDGTLNHFINDIDLHKLQQDIFFLPVGSGNDFAHDVEGLVDKENGLIKINRFVESLPVITVREKKYRFINGIGYGLDGFVCEQGDRVRSSSDKKVNYTNIALNGVLFKYKPVNASIIVDGQIKNYEKVWLAPTMLGKYYGGGMMITPAQHRLNTEHTVSVAVWKGTGRLTTLARFPSVFTGQHVNKEDMFEVRTGHEVTVRFDRPMSLQIDGEVVRDVTEYSVSYN